MDDELIDQSQEEVDDEGGRQTTCDDVMGDCVSILLHRNESKLHEGMNSFKVDPTVHL